MHDYKRQKKISVCTVNGINLIKLSQAGDGSGF